LSNFVPSWAVVSKSYKFVVKCSVLAQEMDPQQLQDLIANAVLQSTQALSSQVQQLQDQIQTLQQQSAGQATSVPEEGTLDEQSGDNPNQDSGETDQEDHSVEEPSDALVHVGASQGTHSVQNAGNQGISAQFAPTITSQLKMPKPEKFTGKSVDDNEIENWIFTLDNLFDAQGATLSETQKLAYAVSYLVEDALSWWQAIRTGQDSPKSWSALKVAMLAYFVSPTKVSDAKDELLALTQRSPEGIHEYIAKFQRLMIMAQMRDEDDKVYAFIRGLRRFTAGSVRMHKPTTLIEAMRLAAEFEGAFRGSGSQKSSKRSAEADSSQKDAKRNKPSNSNRQHFGGGNKGRDRPKFQSGNGKSQSKSAAERYQKTPAEIEALKRQNACFICGQKGHMAQACKSKN